MSETMVMCEPAGTSTVAPDTGEPDLDEPWDEIERRFRAWAFRRYYEKSFASEIDNALRFAKALAASCRPIRNRELVYTWYRAWRKRAYRGRTRHGAPRVPG